MFCVLGLLSANAATVTYTPSEQGYTNGEAIETATVDGVVFDFSKGSGNNAPAYYNTGTALRLYGGNTATITAPEGNAISEIVFSFATGEGTNAITANVGTFETSTWTGDSKSVTFTVGGTSGHRRFASITVTYAEGEGSDNPGEGGGSDEPVTPPAPAEQYTVAEALAIIASGNIPTEAVQVKGYVSKIDEISTSYGNATYYIKDDLNDDAALEVFRGYYLNGDKFTAQDQLLVGALVVVEGVLVDYNGTPEFTTGSKIVSYEAPENGGNDEPETGLGTKEEPYSVSQVIAGATAANKVWVAGFIVGSSSSSYGSDFSNATGEDASNTNIFIAETADESDYTKCVPVQLPAGDVRNALSLQQHPENLGKAVLLYGSLEKYFGQAGLKSVTDFEFVDELPENPGTGDDDPVTPPTPGGDNEVTFDFNNDTYGLPNDNATYVTDGTVIEIAPVKIELNCEGTNGWRLWSDGLRAMNKQNPYFTVTVANGGKVTEVSFTSSKGATFKVEGYEDDANITTWTGNADSVTFVYTASGNNAVSTITVKYESNTTVVDGINNENANAPVEYFNLQGARVANPEAGNLYIVRQGNKVSKTIVH